MRRKWTAKLLGVAVGVAMLQGVYGADFVWTGSHSILWNTSATETNWSGAGSFWSNNATRSTPNTATFDLAAGGTVTVNTSIDVGSITFATGGWTLNSSSGKLAFGGTGTMTIGVTTGSVAVNPVIVNGSTFGTGGGTTSLLKTGNGTLVMGATNTYTGTTTVDAGVLRGVISTGLLTVNGGATSGGVFDMFGKGLSVSGLSGGDGAVPGVVTNNAAGAVTLTLGNAGGTYAGVISDGLGKVGVTRTSSGSPAQVLAGVNTYTGPTVITTSNLVIAPSGSILGSAIALSGFSSLTVSKAAGSDPATSSVGLHAVSVTNGTIKVLTDISLNNFLANGSTGVSFSIETGTTAFTNGGSNVLDWSVFPSGTLIGTTSGGRIGAGVSLIPDSLHTVRFGGGFSTATLTVDAAIGNVGGTATNVSVSSSSKILLNATNTYSGTTTINGSGTLVISSDASLGTGSGAGNILLSGTMMASGDVEVSAGRGITMSGGALTAAAGSTLTYNGVLADVGGVRNLKIGSFSSGGSVALGGANTFSGTVTVFGATLSVGSDAALGTGSGAGNISLQGGGVIHASASFELSSARGIVFGPYGNGPFYSGFDVAAGVTMTYNGVITEGSPNAGSLIKSGPGVMVLGGTSNAFSGSTTVTGGMLQVAGDESTGSSTMIFLVDGGLSAGTSFTQTKDVVLGTSTSSLTASGTLDAVGGAWMVCTGLVRNYSVPGGNGGLTKGPGAGTVELTRANSYVGGTTVLGGVLMVSNTTGSGTGTGAVHLEGGTLGGHGKITGLVTGGAGGHTIWPSVNLPAGSTGTLTVGKLTTNSHTTLMFDVVSPGTSDLLKVTTSGQLVINGGAVSFVGGDAAPLGYYKVVQYTGAIGGTGVGSLSLPAEVGGVKWVLDTQHDAGFVDAHKVLVGDANGDAVVDGSDFDVWFGNLLQPGATWERGDFTGDGMVDGADFDVWFGHLLNTFGEARVGGNVMAVPEAGTLSVLGLGMLALGRRVKRKE